MSLGEAQIERYSRQILLAEIGGRGQERLLRASFALVGSGRVARTAVSYLVGAGIGRIVLSAEQAGAERAVAALAGQLRDLNPEVRIEPDDRGAAAWLSCDAVVCASDASTLARVWDATRAGCRPLIAGGVSGARGWLAVVPGEAGAGASPLCAERTVADSAPRPEDAALSAVAAGVIGSLLSIEAVKLLLGLGAPAGGVWLYDAASATLEPRSAAHPT